MLGKLIKNEIISSSHSMLWIYVAVAVGLGAMATSVISDNMLLFALSMLALLVLGCVLLAVTVINVLVNFNRSMYSSQGYLTFTLPVKSHALLASKAFVAMLWTAASFAVFAGILFCVFYFSRNFIEENMTEYQQLLDLILQFLNLPSKVAIIGLCTSHLSTLFSLSLMAVSGMFLSVTLANTRKFQKMNAFSIVVIGVALLIAVQPLYKIAMKVFPMYLVGDQEGLSIFRGALAGSTTASNLTGILFYLLMALLLLLGTSAVMKRWVNLR